MIPDAAVAASLPPGLARSLDELRAAWDAGDAPAYARHFDADASYVIYAGVAYRGREAIERAHAEVFTRWQRGSRMSMQVLDCRRVAPDVVVLLTEGGVGKGRRIRHDKLQSFTWVRRPEGWRWAAVQKTRRSRWFAWLSHLAGGGLAGSGR
jgi:uncharacterized protein (TIGR02246 family)